MSASRMRLVLFVIICVVCTPAIARNYAVELLVFERAGGSSGVQERWNPASNQTAISLEELKAISREAGNQAVQNGVSRLKRIEGALDSSGHRVIQSLRWVQRGTVYPNAPVVNVGNANQALDGFVRVYKTSLIFVDINLGLAEGSFGEPLFFISEKRRLKFKELHYFDHPRLGAILGVWPA